MSTSYCPSLSRKGVHRVTSTVPLQCGQHQGEKRDGPERKRQIKALGIAETADDDEYDQAKKECSVLRLRDAADLAIKAPIQADQQDDPDGSIGIELLKQFIVRVPRLELVESKGWYHL